MTKINSFRIRNLRSFSMDSKFIPINNINIYVGKNSSGKSTFTRIFPLLRQSIEEKTKGPILWFGNYVDFGSFKSALNINSTEQEIFFDFDITLTDYKENIFELYYPRDETEDLPESPPINILITIGVTDYRNTTSASTLKIVDGHSEVEIKLEGQKPVSFIIRNSLLNWEEYFEFDFIHRPGKLIPDLFYLMKPNSGIRHHQEHPSILVDSLRDYLMKYHHKNKQSSSIEESIDKLTIMAKQELMDFFSSEFEDNNQFFKNIKGQEEEFLEVVHYYCLALYSPNLIGLANEALYSFFKGVRYLGPVRASAERFYRYQDLQINEIDHQGSNLPMVLNSLDNTQKQELKKWINTNFGFSLKVSEEGQHYAILIKEEGQENYFNISDMGFGYSQILPIVVSVWLEQEQKKSIEYTLFNFEQKVDPIIVIEQPELHLHPRLQYKFAKAIAKLSALAKEKTRFVFETHSNHIIDAIGDAIDNNVIEQGTVSITIFEKDENGNTTTEESGFDTSGYLINWPAGFLSS
ncbi:AAA family ATPase [Cobetia marina]|uniref:AAA family ATPase n=1 Tax=Cobetia marina TaxID=28258 RepID=UPI002548CED5|nr:AAA family ATPase [Cobetia pacifica]MDI6003629.1 AAA family ATPase [Cobetia pacifica]